MRKHLYWVAVLSILISRCAIQQPVVKEEIRPIIETPPGIDKLTVFKADSIFSLVRVDDENAQTAETLFDEAQSIEELGDSLWNEQQEGLLDEYHTLLTTKLLERAEKYLQLNTESYLQIKKIRKKKGPLNPELISAVRKNVMVQAVNYYENAIRTNRFNIIYRQGFSNYLQKLAERLKDKSYLNRAADELERVVFVIKDKHQLYFDLGQIYFKLRDWKNAFKNYELAENVLRRTSIFSINRPERYFTGITDVPVDTNRLVRYLDYQAICKTKLYQAQPALALYREARDITPDKGFKDYFNGRIEWILWDDGNIRASEWNEKGDSAFTKNDYKIAKEIYLQLLPILWTKRTKDELNWKIAQIDYQHLDNKAEGVERMFYVIRNSAVDSLTGAPLDSTCERYFDTYGKMCFNLGSELIKKDRLIAYIYFQQAAATNYVEQGKAFLQLAQNSLFDPNETIKLCKKTMGYMDELDNSEKKLLCETFYFAYRKLGDFKNAKNWFEKLKTF